MAIHTKYWNSSTTLAVYTSVLDSSGYNVELPFVARIKNVSSTQARLGVDSAVHYRLAPGEVIDVEFTTHAELLGGTDVASEETQLCLFCFNPISRETTLSLSVE